MTNALSKAVPDVHCHSSACHKGSHNGTRCWNCSIWVSPVWRWQKSLGAMLCNACAICYKTKGHQRAKPSQEELERTAAAYMAKQTKPAKQTSMSMDPAIHSSQSTQELTQTRRLNDKLGKRKRQPKEWGQEVMAYGETDFDAHEDSTQNSDDSSSSMMDVAELTDNYANSYDSLPQQDRLDSEGAAEVLVSLKSVEYPLSRRPKRHASEDLDRPVVTAANEGDTDVKVVLTVRPSKKTSSKGKRIPCGQDRCCVECGATETPTWRKAGGTEDLCNACGVQRATLARKHSMKRQGSVNSRPNTMHPLMPLLPPMQAAYIPPPEFRNMKTAVTSAGPALFNNYSGNVATHETHMMGHGNNVPMNHGFYDTFNFSQPKQAHEMHTLRYLNRDNMIQTSMPMAAQPMHTVMKRKPADVPRIEREASGKQDNGSKRALFGPLHVTVQTF